MPHDLQSLARTHGTPLLVVDHDVIRANYAEFRKHLPRVQAYYAVKANPAPEIARTLYNEGASFDVASMPEFMIVHDLIKDLPDEERQTYIWDKIIYSNPIKANETLQELDPYKPLVAYDNADEIEKIAKHAPHAGLVLRIKVPNTGAMVELSSKFGASPGEAVDLLEEAKAAGLVVEGLSFHVGSQCTNFDNYVQALNLAAGVFKEARLRGFDRMKQLDIGGGFPVSYDENVKPFEELARYVNAEIERLFPEDVEILAEPGRFMVATAVTLVTKIIGRAVYEGKLCYYVDDGLYGTYSGIVFDHCPYHLKSFAEGERRICTVFGPTCDAFDTISLAEDLPADLELGEFLYTENIGAYSNASATCFNGFEPAKMIHVNA